MSTSMTFGDESHNGRVDWTSARRHVQDVSDAAYRVAHEFPGGVPALAQRMGMSSSTLMKKVGLTVDTHHLSLREAVHMQAVTGRFDVLYAMAKSLDHVCLPVPDQAAGDVHARMAAVGAEVGDVFREVQRVLADGRVTPNERKRVATQVAEAIAALAAVYEVL